MNKLTACMIGSALFALPVAGTPVLAQDKAKAPTAPAANSKGVFENDKGRVLETTWKPGEESPSLARGPRVVRTLKGGTLTRIYPDGKTEKITSKDGEVRWFDATPPYAIKNQ